MGAAVTKKDAGSSQVAWHLLTEGVAAARLESHRIRHLVTRVLALVEESPAREHIYEVAGDILQVAPRRMEALETVLDRTAYALSVLGEDHLRDRLPLADRKVVDDAVEKAGPMFGTALNRSAARVAERHLRQRAAGSRRGDLQPPLGWPGGPCHVIERVRSEVGNPKLREELIDDVEIGDDWTNPEAARVYALEVEKLPTGTRFKRLLIGPHGQYRMDLRGITVPQVRAVLSSFFRAYQIEKSRRSPMAVRWEEDFARSTSITWTDSRLRLTIAFAVEGTDVRLVTTYWDGEGKPRPPGEGGCDI